MPPFQWSKKISEKALGAALRVYTAASDAASELDVPAPSESLLDGECEWDDRGDALLNVEATLAALDDLEQAIVNQRAASSRRRNSLMPINRIPGELLILILKHVNEDMDRKTANQTLASFMVVQMSWWTTVQDYAPFWTTIHSEDKEGLLLLKLKKAKGAPLSIQLRDKPLPPGFFESLRDTVDRWTSIEYFGEIMTVAKPFLEAPAINLDDLDLVYNRSMDRVSSDPWQTDLNPGCHPRHLRLRGVVVDWSRFNKLVSLTISRLSSFHIPPSSLLAMLSASPELRTFRLGYIFERNQSNDPHLQWDELYLSNTSIVLPSLRILVLVSLPAAYTMLLLRNIRVHSLNLLTVEHPLADADSGLRIASHVLSSAGDTPSFLALPSPHHATFDIELRGTKLLIEGRGPKFGVHLEADIARPYRWVDILSQTSPLSSPDFKGDIHFTYEGNYYPNSVIPLLRRMPGITVLGIGGHVDLGQDVVSALSEFEGGTWLCPRLKEIQVLTLRGPRVLLKTWNAVIQPLVSLLGIRKWHDAEGKENDLKLIHCDFLRVTNLQRLMRSTHPDDDE